MTQRQELIEQRNESIYQEMLKIMREDQGGFQRMQRKELYQKIAMSPAPRYYLTPHEVGRILSNKIKEKKDASR